MQDAHDNNNLWEDGAVSGALWDVSGESVWLQIYIRELWNTERDIHIQSRTYSACEHPLTFRVW